MRADIDSAADRLRIRVVQGKGGKDRYVPLAADVLEVLRAWWRQARPRQWLFTAASDTSQALERRVGQRWYYTACTRAGITKHGGIHTLRHCCATHLPEAGVDLHICAAPVRREGGSSRPGVAMTVLLPANPIVN
ncbi:tyrosine-type recombinase/integrase [Azohydromonas aeria]|uniref:tyrosine-type recombinase/integrase n=1 Tax=Azohydromonas aeria TaxID=2590212 RepID=UPI0018DF3AFA|nr:tyrosine-type recombinase/integrase [Azohydromonas aeria]